MALAVKKAPTRKARGSRRKTLRRVGGKIPAADLAARGGPIVLLDEPFQSKSGFGVNLQGQESQKTTQGELTKDGVQKIHELFHKYAPPTKGVRSVQQDLGCGIGKTVVWMAQLNPGIDARGIEIVADRIRAAQEVWKTLPPLLQARIQFQEGSFLEDSYSVRDGTWIFLSNLCFDETMQDALIQKLGRELPVGAVIVCSKSFSTAGPEFETLGNFPAPMSWSETSSVIVYRKIQVPNAVPT